MTKSNLIFILQIAVVLNAFGQSSSTVLKLMNETGKAINVNLTSYDKDTLPSIRRYEFEVNADKEVRTRKSNLQVDIVAIDKGDTIFSKSIKPTTSSRKTIRIKEGEQSLKETPKAMARLRITGSNIGPKMYQPGDRVVFKLHSKKKVRGRISSYDRSSVTTITKRGKRTKVSKGDIMAIREMDAVFAANAWFVLFPYYKFEKIEDYKFELVQKVDNGDGFEWTEIK